MEYNIQEAFTEIKRLFSGKWAGEGYAKYPTIAATAYTEQMEFKPDEIKESILFNQKTWYKNDTEKNGHTVFWDTGFIFLKENKIRLVSAQVGGRMETYDLTDFNKNVFTFESASILNDPLSTSSQRIFAVDDKNLWYQLGMAAHAEDFQNHLSAHLTKTDSK
jgi:hypothetical protein